MEASRILIVDNHPLMRLGIKTLLSLEPNFICVGEANDGNEIFSLCDALRPHLIIMDVQFPNLVPSEMLIKLGCLYPELKIIIFSNYDDGVLIRNLISMGISGYILKTELPDALIRAINVVLQGDSWFSQEILYKLVRQKSEKQIGECSDFLTPREMDVLKLMSIGETDLEIARILCLSKSTVRCHIQSILRKLSCSNRTQAAFEAQRIGLL